MKIKIILLALLLTTKLFFSQTITIENVNIPDFKNFGTVYKNSSPVYYSYHTSFNNKITEGTLKFYNENLTDLKKDVFILDKNNIFLEAKNNNSNVIIGFHDWKKELNIFKIYSNDGQLLYSKEISYKKNVFSPYSYKYLEKNGEYSLIFPVNNKGFLVTALEKKKRIGYNVHFFGNEESKNWVFQSPEDHNNRKSVTPIFTNDEIVILMEKEWGSVYDKQPTFTAIILDINTGKELFRVSHEYEKVPNFYTKATVNENGEIILFGEKYTIGNNYPDNDYNIGFFIEKYSKTGTLLASNTLNFDDQNFKTSLKFSPETKQNDFGTVFFQNFLERKGHLFAIGEITRRDKQGFTVAKAIISGALLGVNNIANQNWNTEYSMGNIVLLEFDENLKLIKTHHIEKEKSTVGLNTMVVRPYFNLMELNYDENLNYLFSSKNSNNSFNILYFDRKIINKKPEITFVKSILEDNNILSKNSSKIELGTNEIYFRVIPSYDSNLLLKYDSEKKSIKMQILK